MGIKRPDEVEKIRIACKLSKKILIQVSEFVKEGMTTLDISEFAGTLMEKEHVKSAFLGYGGYPGLICISVNEEVVHGIPSKNKYIKSGDLVSIDLGIVKDGYMGDCALTVGVGQISAEARRLIEVTEESLDRGISKVKDGCRIGDIGWEIETFVEEHNFSVVREFAGHGIGKNLHEEPEIPNFGIPRTGFRLKENMVIAIEPMINMGKPDLKILPDGWTVITMDGLPSAHFENTVLVKKNGFEILTSVD